MVLFYYNLITILHNFVIFIALSKIIYSCYKETGYSVAQTVPCLLHTDITHASTRSCRNLSEQKVGHHCLFSST